MKFNILYRDFDTPIEEKQAIAKYFPNAMISRTSVEPNTLVIGRYSVLPYYQELVHDLRLRESVLVNNTAQHQFVADLGQWSAVLMDLTPKTWRQGEFVDLPQDKSFVLKGQTNSKKFLWDTHMFAKTASDVPTVMRRLLDDTLISNQTIYAREYVPLVTYCYGFNGLPITKEFRVFVLYGKIVASGYYWSSHIEDVKEANNGALPNDVPIAFIDKVAAAVGNRLNFFAVDIAQAINGDWLVVDLNDGQMSGLSCIDANQFYASIKAQRA